MNQNKKDSLILFLGGFFIIKDGKRKRYIGFIVNTKNEDIIDKKDLIFEIRKQCTKIFDRDFKSLGLYLINYNEHGMGILRCKHTEKENTIKLLLDIKEIGSKKVSIKTIATSGTIKTLKRKHMPNF